MTAVEVIGPFRGPTGYDRHTRQFVRELARLGCQVQLTAFDYWSPPLPAGARDPWYESLARPVNARIVLHFVMPNQCAPRPGKINVNYTMFEADAIPADWASRAAEHARIVVPTQACHAAWHKSGVDEERLRVCPLGVDGEYFRQAATPLLNMEVNGRPLQEYQFRFLNVAELRPRKNHLGLLRAWIRATNGHDDAVLILKCAVFQPQNLALFWSDLAEMQARLGRSLAQAAPVVFIQEILSDGQMRALYHSATHYISMSFGEGWDQVMMEAASAGLRPIAPAHSAYVTYLSEADAYMIPTSAVPAVPEGRAGSEDRVFFDGLSWWRPEADAAVAIVQQIVSGVEDRRPLPQSRIIAEYTWERAGLRLLQILNELGQD